MSGKWKKRWDRRLRLPRGWKTARNLIFALVVLLAAPFLLRQPTWSAKSAFRQLEGKYMLPQSKFVLAETCNQASSFLTQSEGLIVTGKVTKLASGGSFWRHNSADLCQILPREGIVVAALPGPGEDGALVVAVTGLPQGTIAGELELDLFGLNDLSSIRRVKDETFTVRAQLDERGWMIFRLFPHESHSEGELCAMDAMWMELNWWHGVGGWPYRLRLLNSGGRTVGTCSGTLPEDQEYLRVP